MTRALQSGDKASWIGVSLTEEEVAFGCLIGARRHMESVAKNRRDRHGFDPQNGGLAIHVEGACGEIAFSKARNRYFGGSVNTFKEADVGNNIQIKTRSRHDYELLVRKDDNPDHVFVLVTGVAPSYRIRGWLWGHQAMQDRFLAKHGGREEAYFIPHHALNPIPRGGHNVEDHR